MFKAYSHALDTYAGANAAFKDVCAAHGGRAPDALFLCAGTARLGFFVELSEEAAKRGMDLTYWVSAWTAQVGSTSSITSGPHTFGYEQIAAKRMAETHTSGKIVFVSSLLGYAGLIGYSTYCPGKHALRGVFFFAMTRHGIEVP